MCVTCFCVLVSLSELLSIIKKEKKRWNNGKTHTYTHKSHTIYSTKTQEDPQNSTGRRK